MLTVTVLISYWAILFIETFRFRSSTWSPNVILKGSCISPLFPCTQTISYLNQIVFNVLSAFGLREKQTISVVEFLGIFEGDNLSEFRIILHKPKKETRIRHKMPFHCAMYDQSMCGKSSIDYIYANCNWLLLFLMKRKTHSAREWIVQVTNSDSQMKRRKKKNARNNELNKIMDCGQGWMAEPIKYTICLVVLVILL